VSQISQRPVVTGFRQLAGGETVEAHWHDQHHLVYASSGVLSVSTDDGTWVAPADRVVWVPASTVHAHRAYGTSSLLTVAVSASARLATANRTTVLAVDPLLRELLRAAGAAGNADAPSDRRLRAVLLDQLREAAPDNALHLPAVTEPRLADAARVLESDPAASLTQVAEQLAVSPRTLARLCRDHLGTTFPQWRTQVRLHRALHLLADGESVTAVAHRTGWASSSAFIDVFHRHLGYTPGQRQPAEVATHKWESRVDESRSAQPASHERSVRRPLRPGGASTAAGSCRERGWW
jgi:AraC-like DNA-binding protein